MLCYLGVICEMIRNMWRVPSRFGIGFGVVFRARFIAAVREFGLRLDSGRMWAAFWDLR